MNRARVALLLVTVTALGQGVATRQLAPDLTPERIGEALALAADEQAARKFLDGYNLQVRAGWGRGPLLGRFSTPFSRVVQAAMAAKTRGQPMTPAEVSPELVAPDLHVIVFSQRAENLEEIARVRTVAMSPRSRINVASVRSEPARIVELTKQYQALHGTSFEGSGLVAIFPLRTVPAEAEIRVIFDRAVRGSSPSATCLECVVAVDLNRIR